MQIEFAVGNERILLRADSLNYELCRPRNRVNTESESVETWEAFKWLATLPQALNKLLDMKVRSSDATDLKQLRDDLCKARNEIVSVWNTENVTK